MSAAYCHSFSVYALDYGRSDWAVDDSSLERLPYFSMQDAQDMFGADIGKRRKPVTHLARLKEDSVHRR